MGQLCAATSASAYSCDNDEISGNSMLKNDEGRCPESDWYMNKLEKLKPIKVLNSSGGRDQCKTRSMVDLVMRPKEEEDLNDRKVLSNSTNGIRTSKSTSTTLQTPESDDELEKMTLGQMQSLLKFFSKGTSKIKNKSSQKTLKKPCSKGVASILPLTDTWDQMTDFGILMKNEGASEVKHNSFLPTTEVASTVGTSMWLSAHTCNATSVEDAINTIKVTLTDPMIKTSEMQEDSVSKDIVCRTHERRTTVRKRPINETTVDSLSNDENVIDDDDAMTLGMWQSHKKRKTSSKKKKRNEQLKVVESSSIADPSLCSLNTSSNIDNYAFEELAMSGCDQTVSSLIPQDCTSSGSMNVEDYSQLNQSVLEGHVSREDVICNEMDDMLATGIDVSTNIENDGTIIVGSGNSAVFDNVISRDRNNDCSKNIVSSSKISDEFPNNVGTETLSYTVNVTPSEIGSSVSNTFKKQVSSSTDMEILRNTSNGSIRDMVNVSLFEISCSVSNTVEKDISRNDCEGLHCADKNQVLGDHGNKSANGDENFVSFDTNHQPAKSPSQLKESSWNATSLVCHETLQLESRVLATGHGSTDALFQSNEVKENTVIEHGNSIAISENIAVGAMIENRECRAIVDDIKCKVTIRNIQVSTDNAGSSFNEEQRCSKQICEPSSNTGNNSVNLDNSDISNTVQHNHRIEGQSREAASANDQMSPIRNYVTETGCTEEISLIDLYSNEKLDSEEELRHDHVKPSKIPSKRKAISPLSREKLIKASRMCDEDVSHRGLKKLPRSFKCYIGQDNFNQDLQDVNAWTKGTPMNEISPSRRFGQKEEAAHGSPCHNRQKSLFTKSSKIPTLMLSECSPPKAVEDLSLVLNNSPSPSPSTLQAATSNSMLRVSPFVPTKGILRSASPGCKGPCTCDECASLRLRSVRAVEFSQQQMHDIEGLTVKLLKELNTMRGVLEETIHGAVRSHSPGSARSLDKAKMVANSAVEAEKMAKTWLVRMARDCNRYCKIMRMQQRKLTFADESGGQLCQVKLFRSKPNKSSYETVVEDSLNCGSTSEMPTMEASS